MVFTFIATLLLVGIALLWVPYVAPGLVAAIMGLVAGNFGALCATAVIGPLTAVALERAWSDLAWLPWRWGNALLWAFLLSGVVAAGMLLIAARVVLAAVISL
jgi:hypothetical protein